LLTVLPIQANEKKIKDLEKDVRHEKQIKKENLIYIKANILKVKDMVMVLLSLLMEINILANIKMM